MTDSMVAEVAAIRRMKLPELKHKYREVFGEETRSNNRDFLWKRIAWRVQELALGGLSERAKQRARDLANEADIRIRPPRGAFSGMEQTNVVATAGRRDLRLPIPGTVVTREYNRETIAVTVLDKGFSYQGKTYRSLSAVAREVTGSQWNGFLFFGLTGKVSSR